MAASGEKKKMKKDRKTDVWELPPVADGGGRINIQSVEVLFCDNTLN